MHTSEHTLPAPQRRTLLALMVASAALLGACAAPTASPAPRSIADTIAADPQLSTLHELVKSAGLTQELAGAGPFTVFAPNNAAFKAVPPKTMDELAHQPQLLKNVLGYHVVSGKHTSADIRTAKLKTLQGATVEVARAGSFITVESAAVTQADVMATNGVVHVVDTVLLPPKK